MQLSPVEEQRFEQFYETHISDFPYVGKDEDGRWTVATALDRLREGTLEYIRRFNQLPSAAAFVVVTDALLREKLIRPIAQPDEVIEAPDAPVTPLAISVEEYKAIPSAVVQRRYQSDAAFRAGVDLLIQQGRI